MRSTALGVGAFMAIAALGACGSAGNSADDGIEADSGGVTEGCKGKSMGDPCALTSDAGTGTCWGCYPFTCFNCTTDCTGIGIECDCTTVGDTCKQTDGTDGTCYLWGGKDEFGWSTSSRTGASRCPAPSVSTGAARMAATCSVPTPATPAHAPTRGWGSRCASRRRDELNTRPAMRKPGRTRHPGGFAKKVTEKFCAPPGM